MLQTQNNLTEAGSTAEPEWHTQSIQDAGFGEVY